MSEPWLEKPYDMNDYRKDINTMKEIYLDKDIKHDMLKLIDKVDNLEQKIINVNTKVQWVMSDLKLVGDVINKNNKYGI